MRFQNIVKHGPWWFGLGLNLHDSELRLWLYLFHPCISTSTSRLRQDPWLGFWRWHPSFHVSFSSCRLPYDNFFGAVTGFTTGNMRQINGFPNVYWGWGGEDDEIWQRVRYAGLPVSRMKGRNGYYDVIMHHHNSAPQLRQRFAQNYFRFYIMKKAQDSP